MVSVAAKADGMATIDLLNYIRHLEANGQTSQRYEIEFWRRHPLSCPGHGDAEMPFATTISAPGGHHCLRICRRHDRHPAFCSTVFSYIDSLRSWQPWLAAAAGLIYMAISMVAFGWLVLRR
jgi:lipopolysaccharide export system permease protein